MTTRKHKLTLNISGTKRTNALCLTVFLGLMLAAFGASAASMRTDSPDTGNTVQTEKTTQSGNGEVVQSAMSSYMTVMPYYLIADDARTPNTGSGPDIDSGTGFMFGYGHQLFGGLYLEAQGFAGLIETGDGRGTDFYQYGLGLDLMYRFLRDAAISPFVLAGLGGIYHDVGGDNGDDTNVFGNVGLGVMTGPLTDGGLRLRAGARYIYDRYETPTSDSYEDVRIAAGVVVPLGERVVERTVVKTVTQKTPVVDSDGDGVPDRNDDCPNTLKGALVDSHGCAKKDQNIKLQGVKFEYDKATLTGSAQVILRDVVKALKGQPGMRIQIAGHTDSIASNEYNQDLSERRAASVKQFLVQHGISTSRLTTIGYGETRPIATNETPEGRQKNRRVVFHILSK